MKSRNYTVYGDEKRLRNLAEEYEYIGRSVKLELQEGRLVVLALPPKPPKEDKKVVRKPRSDRE